MVKNDFFPQKKNAPFHPLRGPTFQVSGLQHKKCGLWRWNRQPPDTRHQTLGEFRLFLHAPAIGSDQLTWAPTAKGNDSPTARALRINYQITS